MAGDLFDDDCVTKDTIAMLCKEMESLPDCNFVITPSNHDPYTEKSAYLTARTTFPTFSPRYRISCAASASVMGRTL